MITEDIERHSVLLMKDLTLIRVLYTYQVGIDDVVVCIDPKNGGRTTRNPEDVLVDLENINILPDTLDKIKNYYPEYFL